VKKRETNHEDNKKGGGKARKLGVPSQRGADGRSQIVCQGIARKEKKIPGRRLGRESTMKR